MRLRRIVRMKDGKRYHGYGSTQVQKLIDDGVLPKPFPLSPGGRAKGWFEDQLIEHQKRIADAAGVTISDGPNESND
jgi:predicted DNA-binding transcriptional regulator AlpA